mgnify:CR=1|jgi:hypothetical protein
MTVRYFEDREQTKEVFPRIINTICPIDRQSEAREIAHLYMTTIESGASMSVAEMLSVELAPIGSEIPTHVFCSRDGFCHQVRMQREFMAVRPEDWIVGLNLLAESVDESILGLFCCVVGDPEVMLSRLGLREVQK